MPFLSPKRKISDTENKLRVLYCLDQLGMATQEQLWPFVAQLELMEYIPLCMFVDELLSDGAIAVGTHAMEGSLYLTAAGRQQLELFSAKMSHADKQRIAAQAPAYAQQLSEQRQVRAAYQLSHNGEFRALGTVREGDVPTMLLQIRSRDEGQIERFVKTFPADAAQVLAKLYLLPLAKADEKLPMVLSEEAALEQALSGTPSLCAYGGREHAAVVKLGTGVVQYTLLLLLPSAEMAWSWVLSAQEANEQLAQELTQLLCGVTP